LLGLRNRLPPHARDSDPFRALLGWANLKPSLLFFGFINVGKSSLTISAKAGWSLGWVSAVDLEGRTIWIADAHRGDGKRYLVRADEKLTAFLELERAICVSLLTEQI
jgi:hypothetical protein